jgi:hypothetical protein
MHGLNVYVFGCDHTNTIIMHYISLELHIIMRVWPIVVQMPSFYLYIYIYIYIYINSKKDPYHARESCVQNCYFSSQVVSYGPSLNPLHLHFSKRSNPYLICHIWFYLVVCRERERERERGHCLLFLKEGEPSEEDGL